MKRTVIILLVIFNTLPLFAQNVNTVVTDKKGNKKLLGITTIEGFKQEPFATWFDKNYDSYLENTKTIKTLKSTLNDYTIKVFFGSWCGDSKRELPRFYKVLEAAKYPVKQLEIVALDRTQEAYKQAPGHQEKGLNIHRVPTFIFYKNGKEVNRIVEEPVETFERDILNITSGKNYRPKYNAANSLGNLLNEKPLDSLNTKINVLRDFFSDRVKHSGELNTLGYVLLSANAIEKALLVFKINKEIFPYKSNVYDSLGEAYYKTKNYSEALKNYYTVLSIKPEDANAKKMIAEIESLTTNDSK